jgi:hypothetical protein
MTTTDPAPARWALAVFDPAMPAVPIPVDSATGDEAVRAARDLIRGYPAGYDPTIQVFARDGSRWLPYAGVDRHGVTYYPLTSAPEEDGRA